MKSILYLGLLLLVAVWSSSPSCLAADAISAANEKVIPLHYEPQVVRLEGVVQLKEAWGPPNYGDPRTDVKERYDVLSLKRSIDVVGTKGDLLNEEDERNVREMEMVFISKDFGPLVGKTVIIEGTLFHAHTGHHHTQVLIEVRRVFVEVKTKN